MNPRQWSAHAVSRIKEVTDRPILYRPHPDDPTPRGIKGVDFSRGTPLEEDLSNAWATVAWNSNSLVSSIIAGVPVFALGPGSMVESIANKNLQDLENPALPDRQQWAHDLAYCQWSAIELEAGLAWKHIILEKTMRVTEPATEFPAHAPVCDQVGPGEEIMPAHRGRGRPKGATKPESGLVTDQQ